MGALRRHLDRPEVAVAVLVVAVALVAVGPDPVPLAGSRLLAQAALVAGAGVTVARAGTVDLGVAAVAGVGAVIGGVLPAVVGLPALLGLPLGALAGGGLGAVHGAIVGRTGRQLGALATLAIGAAVVQVLGTLELVGGVGGFHAVGLPTGGGDRPDALAAGGIAAVLVLAAGLSNRRGRAAAAAVGTADPAVAASMGRSPIVDVAIVGATGGALLGTAGALLAAVDGSVVPDAYGLGLAAALVVAASLGGPGWLGPVVGTLIVWGPATLLPLAPVIGTAPVLVTTGPLALLLLALRRGRPLLPTVVRGRPPARAAGVGTTDVRADGVRTAAVRTADVRAGDAERQEAPVLRLSGTPTPAGPFSERLEAGEIVALLGPNGAGKSTLLARIGGQLPDGGTVEVDGHPAPRGPRRRARVGITRTWQRPPDVATDDAARCGPRHLDTEVRATDVLGADVAATAGGAQLVRLAASRPRVALLDEPTDVPPERLAAYLRALAGDGTAVLVVDHRPEVAAAADRRRVLAGDGEVTP